MGLTGHPTVYVDYYILDLMAQEGAFNDELLPERESLQELWNYFDREEINLVTSVDEMELDFVIHMNRGGLCVTDTFQITDNIDTFERWAESDHYDTSHWRAIVDLYDRLDLISGHDDMVGEQAHPRMYQHVASVMRNGPMGTADHSGPFGGYDEETAILRDCAANLHTVYEMNVWADMKHIRYDLNWEVLKNILPRYNHAATINGHEGAFCKNLLGLLNRVVNIGKKSCPRLPLQDKHIDFILDIVRKKYCQEKVERYVSHIAHSLLNDIDYHLTIDLYIVKRFAEKKILLGSLLDAGDIRLEAILPSELVRRLKSAK
jgi:hypothetical protein